MYCVTTVRSVAVARTVDCLRRSTCMDGAFDNYYRPSGFERDRANCCRSYESVFERPRAPGEGEGCNKVSFNDRQITVRVRRGV